MIVVPNPYAKAMCRAIDLLDSTHAHICTGPSGHGGHEHLCECDQWWQPTGPTMYADHPSILSATPQTSGLGGNVPPAAPGVERSSGEDPASPEHHTEAGIA